MTAHPWLAILCIGCGLPQLTDLDGRLIRHPLRTGEFEGGAIVVDSSGGTLRAVVEVYIELDSGAAVSASPLPLLLTREGTLTPRRTQRALQGCTRLPPGHPGRVTLPEAGGEPALRSREPPTCFVVIRAEFAATDRLPTQPLRVRFGSHSLPVRWSTGPQRRPDGGEPLTSTVSW